MLVFYLHQVLVDSLRRFSARPHGFYDERLSCSNIASGEDSRKRGPVMVVYRNRIFLSGIESSLCLEERVRTSSNREQYCGAL